MGSPKAPPRDSPGICFYASVVLGDPALVGHFTFDPNTRLADSSLATAGLTAPSGTPPTYTADCQWPGAECAVLSSFADSSGGGQYLLAPPLNLGVMSAGGGFSICAWVLIAPTAGAWARVFDFGVGWGEMGVILSRHDTDPFLQAEHRFNYVAQSFQSPVAFRLGQWRHVCVVNKGIVWSIFDNGVLSATYEAWYSVANVELTNNFIGRSFSRSDRLLQGKVDEFRIYKRALSTKEVADIFAYRGLLLLYLWGVHLLLCFWCFWRISVPS